MNVLGLQKGSRDNPLTRKIDFKGGKQGGLRRGRFCALLRTAALARKQRDRGSCL